MSNKDDHKAHVIILPDYCPVAICMTRQIAQDMAAKLYKPGTYTIRPATQQDIKLVTE